MQKSFLFLYNIIPKKLKNPQKYTSKPQKYGMIFTKKPDVGYQVFPPDILEGDQHYFLFDVFQ